jgi:hypothetical protein
VVSPEKREPVEAKRPYVLPRKIRERAICGIEGRVERRLRKCLHHQRHHSFRATSLSEVVVDESHRHGGGRRPRTRDRKIVHRLAQLTLAITLLISAKLIDWLNR